MSNILKTFRYVSFTDHRRKDLSLAAIHDFLNLCKSIQTSYNIQIHVHAYKWTLHFLE